MPHCGARISNTVANENCNGHFFRFHVCIPNLARMVSKYLVKIFFVRTHDFRKCSRSHASSSYFLVCKYEFLIFSKYFLIARTISGCFLNLYTYEFRYVWFPVIFSFERIFSIYFLWRNFCPFGDPSSWVSGISDMCYISEVCHFGILTSWKSDILATFHVGDVCFQ